MVCLGAGLCINLSLISWEGRHGHYAVLLPYSRPDETAGNVDKGNVASNI